MKTSIIIAVRTVAAVYALYMIIGVILCRNWLQNTDVEKDLPFVGEGTKEAPYLITTTEDLCTLRDMVNEGCSFQDSYFLQICDLDLEREAPWEPIGVFGSGNYFYGIYDGGTNRIFHLNCYPEEQDMGGNVGLFGQLGGQVWNLGIESGSIEGAYVGSIASHSVGTEAVIGNCYNRASVRGSGRAGGICDNFSGGVVLNCANFGKVTGGQSAQIVSYNAADVINVYPADGAVSYDFQGIFRNDIRTVAEAGLDFLNDGIDYLNRVDAFTKYNLKHWTEEGR